MSKKHWLTTGFTVTPTEGGSFVMHDGPTFAESQRFAAFSDPGDLVEYLATSLLSETRVHQDPQIRPLPTDDRMPRIVTPEAQARRRKQAEA